MNELQKLLGRGAEGTIDVHGEGLKRNIRRNVTSIMQTLLMLCMSESGFRKAIIPRGASGINDSHIDTILSAIEFEIKVWSDSFADCVRGLTEDTISNQWETLVTRS